MSGLLHAITSGAAPLIMSVLAMLIPAIGAYAVAWLKAQTALQEQAARSAVAHVDAMQEPAQDLTGPEAKALAMQLATAQLSRVNPEKLSAKIDKAVDERRRETQS